MTKTLVPFSVNPPSETWGGLCKVIANTPGFQYWRSTSTSGGSKDTDALVQLYLRETLETLAY